MEPGHSKLKDMLSSSGRTSFAQDKPVLDDINIEPIQTVDASNKSSTGEEMRDPLSEIPVFEITPEGVAAMRGVSAGSTPTTTGKKR